MKKLKPNKLFYEVTFGIGFILLFAQVFFIAKTLINIKTPVLIVLITGLITYFLDYQNYSKLYGYQGKNKHLFPFIHFSASYGGIVLFLFVFINFYVTENEIKKHKYEIIDRGSSYSKKKHIDEATVIIKYRNNTKTFTIKDKDFGYVSECKQLELTTKLGLFDYEILLDKRLICE